MPRAVVPPEVRFWRFVDKAGPNGCWIWTGSRTSTGYGAFGGERVNGRNRNVKAHRFSYEVARGPIPGDLPLDHLCRNPLCCNPDHLEPVTMRVNTLRGVGPSAENAKKRECKHGHAFTPENTWVNPRNGSRHCRTCMRASFRRWAARRRVNGAPR